MGKKGMKKAAKAFKKWGKTGYTDKENEFAELVSEFAPAEGESKAYLAGWNGHKNRERKVKQVCASKKLVGVLIETPREPTGFTAKEATEAFDGMAKAFSGEKEKDVPPFQKALKAAIQALGNAAAQALKSHNDMNRIMKEQDAQSKDAWSMTEKKTRPMTREEVIGFLANNRDVMVANPESHEWEFLSPLHRMNDIRHWHWRRIYGDGTRGEPQKFEVEITE